MPIKSTILLAITSPFKARAILREFIWKKNPVCWHMADTGEETSEIWQGS